MAVAPTGAIYKALKFDGVSSRTYGVYITGEAVYNAPERDVEMITIPGRNGSFALDNGRFQNIEVSYPAGIFADTEVDFRQAISDFRNFLCSRNGYVRLQDEYNPDEYRMAVYKSGLEVTPAMLKAGEFTITFECKPQRWLTSGETKVTIANSGDTITNPTLFESSPLLEITGYGEVSFNGYAIEIENATMGDVMLWDSFNFSDSGTRVQRIKTIPSGLLNSADTFTLNTISWSVLKSFYVSPDLLVPQNHTASITTSGINDVVSSARCYSVQEGEYREWYTYCEFDVKVPPLTFTYGTSKTETLSVSVSASFYDTVNTHSWSCTESLYVVYDGNSTITITWLNSPSISLNVKFPAAIGSSSVSILGNPTYIDCDLGIAYLINGGVPVSLNSYIDLGSKLPVLVSGSNAFTYDNTITSLKVVPRWWKV